jgi:hypothetical protein
MYINHITDYEYKHLSIEATGFNFMDEFEVTCSRLKSFSFTFNRKRNGESKCRLSVSCSARRFYGYIEMTYGNTRYWQNLTNEQLFDILCTLDNGLEYIYGKPAF